MSRDWVILGDGGHARAVQDVIGRRGERVVGHFSPDSGFRTVHPGDSAELSSDQDVVAWAADRGIMITLGVGDVSIRRRMLAALEGQLPPNHPSIAPLVDPSATVSDSAILGRAVQVLAHAHVGPGACVGGGALINTAAVVEHDAVVGEASHIAPHATLLGGAEVGSQTLVGAGAVVLVGVRLGGSCTVAAGAVVTRDQPGSATLMGTPARPMTGVDHD